MEQETIIITTGKNSSCLKENKFGGDPKTDCVSVHVGRPESVIVLEGHPKLYTEAGAKRERLEGQNEAWELAQKILELPSKGGYTPEELIDIFGSDAVPYVHDLIRRYTFHDVVTKIHEREEKKAKEFHPGDVVALEWGSGIRKAVVTMVMSDLLGVVLDTGSVYEVDKNRCTKTGKTFNITSLLCELNEE